MLDPSEGCSMFLLVGENKVKTIMIKVIELADDRQSLESRNQTDPETQSFLR